MKDTGKNRTVRLDLLSFEQAEEVYRIKKRQKNKNIEEIAVELGFLERDEEETVHSPVS